MRKSSSDPKVKKTLVRNFEGSVKNLKTVIHDVDASSSKSYLKPSQKQNDLDQPTLCSSELLANYLCGAKKQPLPRSEDLNVDKAQLSAKMTKKLNFHFNDRIYKNLIQLNADGADLKNRKDKKPSKIHTAKKDLEPNIEDFCEDLKESDECPHIPVVKPKFKPIRQIEREELHKLVSSFEVL